MVGNDVIDLGDPEALPGACHRRFDARVFAPAELAQLDATATPARLRWILWAAKEASYKVAKKRDASIVFSPCRFVVRLTSSSCARVEHATHSYSVELEADEHYVHAVASADGEPGGSIVAGIERLPWGHTTCPSSAVRTLAIRTLAPLLGSAPSDLAVAREQRVPRLRRAGEPTATDLSLSHHGRFVAFACSLERESELQRGAS